MVLAALAAALLGLVLWVPGVALADPVAPPVAPYGGALDDPDPGDDIDSEQILEVAMLTLGAFNGVAVIVAIAVHRWRGSSAAETRAALRRRTGAGVVSESRRERRENSAVPVVDPEPVVPARAVAPSAPPSRLPQPRHSATPPPARPAVATARGVVPGLRGAAPVALGDGVVPGPRGAAPVAPGDGVVPGQRGPSPVSPARGLPTAQRR